MHSDILRALPHVLLCLCLPGTAGAQQAIGSIVQQGRCTVAGVVGNVTVNCPGDDPELVRTLNRVMNQRIKDRDVRIDEITRELHEWREQYLVLARTLTGAGLNSELKQRAQALLRAGNLDEAGRVLDEVLARTEYAAGETARTHFERATLYDLQFLPSAALPHYERAYRYRPDNTLYGQAYASLLTKQSEFVKAGDVFEHVLSLHRVAVEADGSWSAVHNLATTLNNLGNVFSRTHRTIEAAARYDEALRLRRQLLDAHPSNDQYKSDVAATLNNLGNLYKDCGRFEHAAAAYEQSLALDLELGTMSAAHRAGMAATLNNAGILAGLMKRYDEALERLSQALQIRRELADVSPAHRSDVASTFNNLGVIYDSLKRHAEALEAFRAALDIDLQLAHRNERAYLPQAAISLDNLVIASAAAGDASGLSGSCSQLRALTARLSAIGASATSPALNSVCQR